ncbi:rRNA maturation RNase YbeY [Paenibacillus sp. N1-5-1-14]|uniref:rRNA maturation RNase YbeY n=1 Tax=Paenibacillus radicibacter TaxID=2972488 RepID=UPI002159A2D1|nr:rRNA maturation RNase YbeY [Paenibacillus radicibacter]MCR8641974.1 rRNA maturation RNase YbeY [Paenibacillus radicibacter]
MAKLRLDWVNEQEGLDISAAMIGQLKELLEMAAEQEGISEGEVSLSFVDDETIQELNKQYRGLDKPTDVLSFAMQEMFDGELEINYDGDYEEEEVEIDAEDEEDGDSDDADDDGSDLLALGDIIISIPTALAQAEEYGHSVEREIGFLFVHGFFHLIGYDHENEEAEKEMFGKQETVLAKAGLTR